MLNRITLDRYLDGVKHLPPTPTLMLRLIELFRLPDRDADEIVQLTRRDPALAAEVLRRCNNSIFDQDSPIMDINEAVFRLGFYEVYRITILLFGMRSLTVPDPRQKSTVEYLRKHSVITALASGAIAREVGESEGVAFTTGLHHDLGKLVLLAAEGPQYAEMMEKHGCHGMELCEAEVTAFEFNHGQIGARLLERWGVPERIAGPVSDHHDLNWADTHGTRAHILHLANQMAQHIQTSDSTKLLQMPQDGTTMDALKLDSEQVVEMEILVRSSFKQLPPLLAV